MTSPNITVIFFFSACSAGAPSVWSRKLQLSQFSVFVTPSWSGVYESAAERPASSSGILPLLQNKGCSLSNQQKHNVNSNVDQIGLMTCFCSCPSVTGQMVLSHLKIVKSWFCLQPSAGNRCAQKGQTGSSQSSSIQSWPIFRSRNAFPDCEQVNPGSSGVVVCFIVSSRWDLSCASLNKCSKPVTSSYLFLCQGWRREDALQIFVFSF